MEFAEPRWEDRTEGIWAVVPKPGEEKLIQAFTAEAAARGYYSADPDAHHAPERALLIRSSLAPVYGGPTLIEALWNEMDRLIGGLMTGEDCEDGGDKYRAQELAWVLAVVTNPYEPSVDRIRAEAMARWNSSQEEQ